MADATDPVLLVMSGDRKRLLWLRHHVTSRWPNARVSAAPADGPALAAAVVQRDPDAVLLQVDFSSEARASSGLEYLRRLLRASPEAHGIVLAENGSELSAVRAMKCGARDYLPLERLSRDSLLKAVAEAHERRRDARSGQATLLADPASLADPAHQASPAHPASLAYSAQPADPGEPADRANSADRANPADRANSAGRANPADRANSADAGRPASPAHPADHPKIQVPGYHIVKEISTTNFSSVFLARSDRLRRSVVLKVMSRGSTPRELDDADRFQREYEIISSIRHRAIVEIYDFGALPEQQYLTMEYIPCGDLRDRLRNPLSLDESLYYLRSIAEALRVIHAVGILHRDLKPANVMLREDNSPVLIDFGLARRSVEDTATTGAGQVLGSPYYISPEQSRGRRVDARTDLYSLGVMFFEMLTGQRPYIGRTALAIMTQHVRAAVPRLPSNVALQQALIDRLMAKRLADRYASAEELLADLGPNVAAA
jgi:ActR/RegA family two-component response regulator